MTGSNNQDEISTESNVTDLTPAANVIKHPLEHTWSFWLQANNKKKWQDNLVELTTFDTAEDYWCLYHHMKLPSELAMGQDYAIFKQGIRPMWEDQANELGGRWLIIVERGNAQELDRVWLDTVLLLIGENFEDADMICGVVVNVRVKAKIAVWTKLAANSVANNRIGKSLKALLRIKRKLEYQKHDPSEVIYSL